MAKEIYPDQEMLGLTKQEFLEGQEPGINSSKHITYFVTEFDLLSLYMRIDDKEINIPSYKKYDEDNNFDTYSEEDIEIKPFQRSYVWTEKQKDRLLESIFLDYPMPNIFLITRKDGTFAVLDGQQRLTTIHKFMSKKHTLGKYFEELEEKGFYVYNHEKFSGKKYNELPEAVKRKFKNYRIPATIIKPVIGEHSAGSGKTILESSAIYTIFERLNSGGTQLTPHEVRMAAFAGDLMECFALLNENHHWRALYGPQNKRSRDHELLTRIFAMYMYRDNYKGSPKEYLNNFCDEYKDNLDKLEEPLELFKKAISIISNSGLGNAALRTREDGKSTVSVAWSEAYVSALMETLKKYGDNYTQKQYSESAKYIWRSLIIDDKQVEKKDSEQSEPYKPIKTYISSDTSSVAAYNARFDIIKSGFKNVLLGMNQVH